MAINKHYVWVMLFIGLFCKAGFAQDVTGSLQISEGSDNICQGSLVQVTLALDNPRDDLSYNWSVRYDENGDGIISEDTNIQTADDWPTSLRTDNNRDLERINILEGAGGMGDDHTFIRFTLEETARIFVQVNNLRQNVLIEVAKKSVAGTGKTIFLCDRTGTIDLFDQIEGGPDTGGTWTYKDVNDGSTQEDVDGVFEIGTDEPNIFTYKVTGTVPCPDSSTTVSVKSCSDVDYDNDGVLNENDLDSDNDGILDADENAICIRGDKLLSPTQLSENERFGFGPEVSSNGSVSDRLDHQIGIPQDIDASRDGEYNVATSTYLYNFNNESAFYVATNSNNHEDGDGNVNGRYLAINMQTGSFLPSGNNVIYERVGLPVTGGAESVLSMKVVNLNGGDADNEGGGKLPSLRIEIVDSANNVIASRVTGDVPENGDKWIEYPITFTPPIGVSFVNLRILNLQDETGEGNDLGIDNIILSRLECDFDNDGIPNYLDRDSDNDGIFDAVEAGFLENQVDATGQLVGGQDDEGVPTIAAGGVSLINENYLNLDSDADGCSDANEAYADADADGALSSTNTLETGVYGIDSFDPADSVNFDGLVIGAPYTFPVDDDRNNVLDYVQVGGPDSDGDGVPNACDDEEDHDNDGVVDADDLDDDNDGILDEVENGGVDPFGDADTDGILNYMDPDFAGYADANADGIDDQFDFDLDGLINQFDLDSDNDGIYDIVEALGANDFATYEGVDGMAIDDDDNVDNTATDGLPSSIEAVFGTSGITPLNSEGATSSDYLNFDSDADGCSDANEAYNEHFVVAVDADGGDGGFYGADAAVMVDEDFGRVDAAPYAEPNDEDGNGTFDFQQVAGPDVDLDGISDACDDEIEDNDEDGVPDAVDLDDDNDGILDEVENGGVDPFGDADTDGILNYMDPDFAGYADANTDGIDDQFDFDLDGLINQFDLDSDNDGIYDIVEALGANDFATYEGIDGMAIDDDDNVDNTATDGLPTSIEAVFGTSGITPLNSEGATSSDYLNFDSDADGCSDANEAYNEHFVVAVDADGGDGGFYGSNAAVMVDEDFGRVDAAPYTEPKDEDGNGTFDFQQVAGPDVDLDGTSDACDDEIEDNDEDGVPDAVDLDDDNDGILDEVENVCAVISTARNTGDYNVTVYDTSVNYTTMTSAPDFTSVLNTFDDDVADGSFVYNEYSGTGNSLSISFAVPAKDGLTSVYGATGITTETSFALVFEKTITADEAGFYNFTRNPLAGNGLTDRSLDNFSIIYLNGEQIYASEELAFSNPNGIDLINQSLKAGDVLQVLVIELTGGDTELGYTIGYCDCDNDGIINQFDLDSDNDGIYDYVEAGEALTTGVGNGLLSLPTAVDANGVPTIAGGGLSAAVDLDGDRSYNFLDIDADGDGISDNLEAQPTIGYISLSGADSDGNGVDDAYDSNGTALDPVSTGPGDADYINTDSDGDICLNDIDEAYDVDEDGVSDIIALGVDSDADGLDDAFDTITSSTGTAFSNSGNGQIVSAFPNNHTPITTEVDYREEYVEITEVVMEPQVLCETEDPFRLFDLIETLTTNENGKWTGAGITTVGGEVFDWELDPSIVGESTENYVYTLPQIGTCPVSTFTVTIEVIEEPFAGLDNPTATVCESVTSVVLYDLLLPNGTDLPDVDGVWTSTDVSAVDLPTTYNGTFSTDLISLVGDSVTFTYTVGANNCTDFAEITLEKTSERNAGEVPTDALIFCGSDTNPFNLLDALEGAEEDGVWSSTDDTVTDLTIDSLGTIIPSDLAAGTYSYEYFLAPTTCEEAMSIISIQILQAPDAGIDGIAEECSSTVSINLFEFLAGTPQETNSLNEEGVWTDIGGTPIGVDHLGELALASITSGDVFTYTVGSDSCTATAEVTVNITATPSPGTPLEPLFVFCESSTDVQPLFDLLDGADTGGTWSNVTGEITPSVLGVGTFAFTYTVAGVAGTVTCDPAISTIEIEILPELYAGENTDNLPPVCRTDGRIILFNLLDRNEPITPGGTWTSQSGNVVFTDEIGTLDILNDPNVLDQDRYTYTVSSGVAGGCDDASAFIDIVLTEDRDLGTQSVVMRTVCTNNVGSVDLFTVLDEEVPIDLSSDTDGSWSGSNATTGGHLGTFLITNAITPGDYTFKYTLPAIGGCLEADIDVVLTIVTANTPVASQTTVSICEGETNPQLSVTLENGFDAVWRNMDTGAIVGNNTAIYTPVVVDEGLHLFEVRSVERITGCESDPVNISFTIHDSLPLVELPSQIIVCDGEPTVINSQLSAAEFDFEWFNNNVRLSETGPILTVFEQGDYHVEYTSKTFFNSTTSIACRARSINSTEVIQVGPPTNIELFSGADGFAEFNSITVNFDGDPFGDYEFDLDGAIFQTENVFENVATGLHTVTITDLNSCGEISAEKYVIGFPKFFTPNGDGANEFWNVDLDPLEPMEMTIFVYDRFGKLLNQVFPDGQGWDGTFAGDNMPSDDYWFLATVIETGETFSSHFTLKR